MLEASRRFTVHAVALAVATLGWLLTWLGWQCIRVARRMSVD